MALSDSQLFYTEVGKLIREERIKQELTQEDLASKNDALTRTMIANIETAGRQQILLHTFIAIAEALEVSPEKLLPKNKIDKTNVKEKIGRSKEAKIVFADFFNDSKTKKV